MCPYLWVLLYIAIFRVCILRYIFMADSVHSNFKITYLLVLMYITFFVKNIQGLIQGIVKITILNIEQLFSIKKQNLFTYIYFDSWKFFWTNCRIFLKCPLFSVLVFNIVIGFCATLYARSNIQNNNDHVDIDIIHQNNAFCWQGIE